MNLRSSFLQQWSPYPAISKSYSLARWSQSQADLSTEAYCISGQVLLLEPDLVIASQGYQLSVKDWQSTEIAMGFKAKDVLVLGDHIAVKVVEAHKLSEFCFEATHLTGLQLLTPYQTEKALSTALSFVDAEAWSEFLQAIRDFFKTKACLEVHTPSLVTCPGMESSLDPFATNYEFQNQKTLFYLPTSPELHLKKMLSLGWTDIFEIKNCFRNGEHSHWHQPEFWMLEWYRAYADLTLIEQDLVALIAYLQQQNFYQGVSSLEWQSFTVAELFDQYLGFKLTPQSEAKELYALARDLKVPAVEADSFNDLFHLIFISHIENRLNLEQLTLIKNYPPSQAALARINAEGWADRFELYWQGVEVANAFHELNNPEVQRLRFKQDNLERQRLGKSALPIDEDFLTALDQGLPPTGGIALGLERLFCVCRGLDSLNSVRAFPVD